MINTNCPDGLACFSFRLSRSGIKKGHSRGLIPLHLREDQIIARRFAMKMNKVQMTLLLVENIDNHLLLVVIHQIIALAALQQEGFQAEIVRFSAARAVGKARH